MMTNKITHSVDYNYWLKRLVTQLNETANQNSSKVPKERYYETLGTSVKNS